MFISEYNTESRETQNQTSRYSQTIRNIRFFGKNPEIKYQSIVFIYLNITINLVNMSFFSSNLKQEDIIKGECPSVKE